jgi:hypothetical protein
MGITFPECVKQTMAKLFWAKPLKSKQQKANSKKQKANYLGKTIKKQTAKGKMI